MLVGSGATLTPSLDFEKHMQKASGFSSWNDLQFVLAVARHGSFLKGAKLLETNQSTVARRIQRLERALGTKLFDRHAHGMELTPPGQVLFDKAVAMENITREIGTQLAGLDTEPMGTVRICVTEGLGYLWLTPVMAEFCELYPDIDIEVVTNGDGADLLARESDIMITLERPTESRLVVSRVARVKLGFFLSQRYAAKYGVPTNRAELEMHRFCDYTPYHTSADAGPWLDQFTVSQRVRFRTNSASVYLAGIRGGIGIGLLPMFYQLAASDLLELALDSQCSSSLWMVSHEETNKARRTRLVMAFLAERFSSDRGRWFETSPTPVSPGVQVKQNT
jgi:DNA-binding transcriptional LysR family regulator